MRERGAEFRAFGWCGHRTGKIGGEDEAKPAVAGGFLLVSNF